MIMEQAFVWEIIFGNKIEGVGNRPLEVRYASVSPVCDLSSSCWESLGGDIDCTSLSYPLWELRELGYLYTSSC